MRPFLLLALGLCACRDPAPPAPPRAEPVAPPSAPASAAPSAVPPAAPPPAPEALPGPPSAERYPWLADPNLEPKAVETLRTRFPPPPGFRRVVPVPKSFGEWLGDLPLAEAGTPVRAFDGRVLHPATDKRIAAVVALDVSRADLQQCADTVIRLHAEWRWSQGARDMSYRAAAGMELPWSRWASGERIVPKGASIQWVPGSKAVDDHASFRKYLDAVFAWANTVSLEKQARQVLPVDLRAGDFFILPGNPGHVVLVLDVARGKERVALLGQSFMPAQNMQVLRAPDGGPWFHVDPSKDVDTPFWKPFPWGSLRRLPE
ncbi:MAG: hypothetical protein HS104_04320 [Polyangiaceae bacterium]|nr:hypothetical protein [Polyangiaceae bacterium]MCL4756587.1 hypothetical protein [Myxococcales bacterium]